VRPSMTSATPSAAATTTDIAAAMLRPASARYWMMGVFRRHAWAWIATCAVRPPRATIDFCARYDAAFDRRRRSDTAADVLVCCGECSYGQKQSIYKAVALD
jgi:hypothetical protein